jgi:hypothetical protein
MSNTLWPAPVQCKLYWDARFLMSQMPSNGRPLEEEEKKMKRKRREVFHSSLHHVPSIISLTSMDLKIQSVVCSK